MLGELVLRFVIGGVVVSMFSLVAELFEPQSFAGLFGAAPSVAIASLAITYTSSVSTARTELHWMLLATPAMFAYCVACTRVFRHREIPAWLGAFGAWLVWFAIAAAIWLLGGHP